ncbi:hypothetical protein M595_5379 [Lyngbya aestuarii BL J]|uniref:Uncharacterized protein n=1 Tax=Lyngbya aestuarii BL J TaxID=1348334 RepID=U7QD69_9CYAN|nr:hypothetical protein M595_5379 [Lyngbya aestuarii BL J]
MIVAIIHSFRSYTFIVKLNYAIVGISLIFLQAFFVIPVLSWIANFPQQSI